MDDTDRTDDSHVDLRLFHEKEQCFPCNLLTKNKRQRQYYYERIISESNRVAAKKSNSAQERRGKSEEGKGREHAGRVR